MQKIPVTILPELANYQGFTPLNKRLINPFVVLGLLVTFILLLSWLISNGSTNDADTYLLRLPRSPAPDYLPIGSAKTISVIRDFTSIGSGVVLTCLTVCVALYFAIRKETHTTLFVILTILFGWLTMEGLKLVYHRDRPTVVPHLMVESSLSLPSGHSMMSTVVFLALAGIAAGRTSSRPLRVFYFCLAGLLALLIGATRVYLGVHHPSDVLAGWLLGLAWVQFAFLASSWLVKDTMT